MTQARLAQTPPAQTLTEQLQGRGWRLRFPQPLEAEFQTHYAATYQSDITLAMLLGLIATLACGIGDWLWMPDRYYRMWAVRIVACLPLLALYIIARQPRSRPYLQWLVVIDAVAGSIGVEVFANMAPPPISHFYQGGILLVMLLIFVLCRLQFRFGLMVALFIVGICQPFILQSTSLLSISGREIILLLGLLLSLPGSFLIERSLRQNYLQVRLLSLQNREVEEANRQLQYLTAIDGLTLIANRRTLDSTLATEWVRAQRKQQSLSLLMIDVDHFKRFNDTFGHPAGDSCLRQVAETLRSHVRRPGDLAARYGGEEFAVVLSGTDAHDALLIAENIRMEILSLSIPHPESNHGHVTVSIGCATLVPERSGSPSLLYERADQALYRSKRSGRNRVMAWSPET